MDVPDCYSRNSHIIRLNCHSKQKIENIYDIILSSNIF